MNQIAPFPTKIDPSVLAARLSDERAPDIVEALNEEAPEVRRRDPARAAP